MLSHFPSRRFEQVTFDQLREAWEPAHLKKTPLPRVAVEALKGLPSYGVDDYVFPSKPTAKWPDPKKPYRWDMGKPFRALVRSLGIEDVRLHDLRHTGPSVLFVDAGHSWRRGEEDYRPPVPGAGAVSAPVAAVPGSDCGPDRAGPLQ
jgi:hypothetical protein